MKPATATPMTKCPGCGAMTLNHFHDSDGQGVICCCGYFDFASEEAK